MLCTIKKLNDCIKSFCDSHKMVASYHNEPMNNLISSDLEYPLVWLVLDNFTFSQGELVQEAIVLFLDKGDDFLQNYSDMIMIAEDMHAYFNENEDKFNFLTQVSASGSPFIMKNADNATGVQMTFTFKIRMFRNEDQIPLT